MAFATPDDVAARWRALSSAEETRAEVLLSDAAWWLKVWLAPYGDVEALAVGDAALAEGLKILSSNMVRRSLAGGAVVVEGASSMQNTMGPFSANISFRNPDGNLFIYDSERDAILSLLGVTGAGAVSMTAPGL